MTTDQTLRAHGLDGDRLLKLARRCATDAQRKAPAGLQGKYEDLVSFLTLQALETVNRYDTSKTGPNYTLASYLYDVMQQRVTDFYRRKSEGYGDRRYGNDNRITLAGHTIDEQEEPDLGLWDNPGDLEPDDYHRFWEHASRILVIPMHDWPGVNEQRAMRWTRAATALDQTLDGWIRHVLDLAAEELEHHPDKQAA